MQITLRDKTFTNITSNPQFTIGDIIMVTVKSCLKLLHTVSKSKKLRDLALIIA